MMYLQFCLRAKVMGISCFGCIYYAGQVQLCSPGSPFVQFWGTAGGHLCLSHKPCIPPLSGNWGTWSGGPGLEGRLERERCYRCYV